MAERGVVGRTVVVEPVGEYAEIDTSVERALMAALLGPDEGTRHGAVAAAEAAPERYAPPVLYALSAALLHLGRPDDAAYRFFCGQVRARFDANRCTDRAAGSGVAVLNERFGPQITAHAFADRELLRRTVIRAVAWDRTAPHAYDHRWIALHGMGAFTGTRGGGGVSLPPGEWDAVAARTRATYLADLRALLRSPAA
jgi:AcrR family transcriptional regulator